MKKLWTLINELKIRATMKNTLYLGLMVSINIIVGGLIWLLLGRLFLPGIYWMMCFMGYPAIITGFFGGIIHLYNHEFSNLPE